MVGCDGRSMRGAQGLYLLAHIFAPSTLSARPVGIISAENAHGIQLCGSTVMTVQPADVMSWGRPRVYALMGMRDARP